MQDNHLPHLVSSNNLSTLETLDHLNAANISPGLNESIRELINTLECPVCLDIASRPPIYQCPEGHLLCETCNQRLDTCPVCRIDLLNSRNRTAEDLCDKLLKLQGNSRRSNVTLPQTSISVSEPRKLRKGLLSPIVYTLRSKSLQEPGQSVDREYKDFVAIYTFLSSTYSTEGIIVPPPPKQTSIKEVFQVASLSPDEDMASSSTSYVFESRCAGLERYLKRMVRHPVINKDPVFQSFLQDKLFSRKLVKPSFSGRAKEILNSFRSRIIIDEKDAWFTTRISHLAEMAEQLEQMQIALSNMSKLKLKLYKSSNQFRRELFIMLANQTKSREVNLSKVVNEIVDCQKIMCGIFEQQSKADMVMKDLSTDYSQMVDSIKKALNQRRNLQMDLELAHKKALKKVKSKPDEESNIAPQDVIVGDKEVVELRNRFENVSRTLRRELEHFDVVMNEEFEAAFTTYKGNYWKSLRSVDPNFLKSG